MFLARSNQVVFMQCDVHFSSTHVRKHLISQVAHPPRLAQQHLATPQNLDHEALEGRDPFMGVLA